MIESIARKFTAQVLRAEGFEGFVTFDELRAHRLAQVPEGPGIYVVLREASGSPVFLAQNPGGRFKGKDPTTDVSILQARWVDGAQIVYIGKANRLRRRLREFAAFGAGRPVGHWGGRYVWQIAGSESFLVAWNETLDVSPRQAEP